MSSNDAYAYTSSYLNAEMLKESVPLPATIREVIVEKFGRDGGKEEHKPVVYFEADGNFPFPDKGLALNKGNIKILIALTGTSKMPEWKGQKVTLVVAPAMYMGKPTEGIRIEKGV